VSELRAYFESVRRQLQDELAQSSMSYLAVALELFHSARANSARHIQPPIGNLGIATELMLKTLLASKNPVLLFRDLNKELRAFLACPDGLPTSFDWRLHDISLRSFDFKTVELDECIATFYVFFPGSKQELEPYFRLLSHCRNASVHASLPRFRRYDLDRTAYLALNVFRILSAANIFGYRAYPLEKRDEDFLLLFVEERASSVKEKIQKAKEESKKLPPELAYRGEICPVDDWDHYVTSCPVCDCDGILTGTTGLLVEKGADEEEEWNLRFLANGFECESCGLKLEDAEELVLAGMEKCYDRSDDLRKWYDEYRCAE
jgi:hypothetical protein